MRAQTLGAFEDVIANPSAAHGETGMSPAPACRTCDQQSVIGRSVDPVINVTDHGPKQSQHLEEP
jgi:hypothetical protein